MLSALIDEYGLLGPPASVIYNGTDVPGAPAGIVKHPFALAAGRLWDEAKNLGVLDQAAGLLTAGSVRVAGDPDSRTTARHETMLGSLEPDQLADVRRHAAVFVAPARYEPFGLAVLEAARDRCALVLGDIPSLRELWDGAALFVSPDDPAELAATLGQLRVDPPAAAALGARAQQRSRRFTATAMAGGYAALYRALAGRQVEALAR
jgi:glycosyltransferase involved in cell wall biosynthesis